MEMIPEQAPPSPIPTRRAGMAGLIITILVMSYLVIVVTSGITVIQTEIRAQSSGKFPEQARVAAMNGIQFYIGCVMAASETAFVAGSAANRLRLHFLSEATRNVVNVVGQQIATYTGAAPAVTYGTIAISDWMFPTLTFSPDYPDVASSSIFIIKTYAHEDGGTQLASYVYVKSLGCFREIQGSTVIASHYCQLLARIEYSSDEDQEVVIDKMRRMPVQYPSGPTSDFHAKLVRPW